MDALIKKSEIYGEITIHSSKSHLHRALIAASLSNKKSKLIAQNMSDDISATISCLKELSAKITIHQSYIEVYPIDKHKLINDIANNRLYTFNCMESATTYRFFLSIAAVFGINAVFLLGEGLAKRKIDSIYELLLKEKVSVKIENNTVKINGKLKSNDIKIDASISSQFVSGILLAKAFFKERAVITAFGKKSNKIVSNSYILMTINVIKDFGVNILIDKNSYIKPNNESYLNNFNKYYIEGDFSNAAFFMALKAINSNEKPLILNGLSENSIQGDRIIIDTLKKLNTYISFDDKKLVIKGKGNITNFNIDISDTPDLMPVYAVLAIFAEGSCHFKNVDRLKYKESNRLKYTCDILKLLNVAYIHENNSLIINAKSKSFINENSKIELDAPSDHRMVMMLSIIACALNRDFLIKNIDSISKSYPDFFDALMALHANIELIKR